MRIAEKFQISNHVVRGRDGHDSGEKEKSAVIVSEVFQTRFGYSGVLSHTKLRSFGEQFRSMMALVVSFPTGRRPCRLARSRTRPVRCPSENAHPRPIFEDVLSVTGAPGAKGEALVACPDGVECHHLHEDN